MRLALSNLAITADNSLAELAELRSLGLRGLEVAPTKIGPWSELTPPLLTAYAREVTEAGLEVSSLQALLFGTNGLQLLADVPAFEAMAEHLRLVSAIGAQL